jgi:hypothetical protein
MTLRTLQERAFPSVDVQFDVKAAQRQAWDVLVDFDRMPDYVPYT